jgi:hypothetical protein
MTVDGRVLRSSQRHGHRSARPVVINPLDQGLNEVLHDYFAGATTTTMARYHQSADDVPNGLSVPHWSWDGLQV